MSYAIQACPERENIHVVQSEPDGVYGLLGLPENAKGLIVFVHGLYPLSPWEQRAASMLRRLPLATLMVDLMTVDDETHPDEIIEAEALAARLVAVTRWARSIDDLAHLPLGYFASGVGLGVAFSAAAQLGSDVSAIVSHAGRVENNDAMLAHVRAPTLFVSGGGDQEATHMAREALARMECPKWYVTVPGVGKITGDRELIDDAATFAAIWYSRHLH